MQGMTTQQRRDSMRLNGIRVARVHDSIFIPLPKEAQRSCDGCVCRYCSADGKTPNRDAAWDTLAVSRNPHYPHTWTVHAPEIHGAKPLR
jgi:hypothetical protein